MTNPALMVIDVQYGIDESDYWGGNRNNPDAEKNIGVLLSRWRERNRNVVIVEHRSKSDKSPFFPGKEGARLKEVAGPLRNELHIVKTFTNAFVETRLNEKLLELNIDSLVICGFVTNNSVEATARFAAESGFQVIVVSDATATFNKRGLDGSVFDSEVVHALSLSNLNGEYATIMTTSQVIERYLK